MRTLTRPELTAALAARQMLLERERIPPREAIRRLTPLQGQHAPAPYVALAARLDGFRPAELEAAVESHHVVKTTIMRVTLHLAEAGDYPFYAQMARQTRMRAWRKRYAHLDEARVIADLSGWLAEPRTNGEIRERVRSYDGVTDERWPSVMFARTLLPLVQLPPAGFWKDQGRPSFAIDPRPLPNADEAAALVLRRYLSAFGPASRRDLAAWSGAAQRDFAEAWRSVPTVSYRDERGTELFDLPDQALPPGSTRLPVRLLARWDQPLLAYADRDRIIPPEVQPLRLTLSGASTLTVGGRVAASWRLERRGRGRGRAVRIVVTPHVEIARAARTQIRAEAERTARFCEPDARRVEVVGV